MLLSYGGLIIAQDALSISGNVTDFEGHPISDCAVILMDKHFCVVDTQVISRCLLIGV